MTTKKEFLEKVRGSRVGPPLVAPYMGNFSIAWSGMSLSACYKDAAKLACAQLRAWERFGQDAIVVQSDNYYMAEAFGAPVSHDEGCMPVLRGAVVESPDDIGRLVPVDPRVGGRMPVYIEAIARVRESAGPDAVIRGCGTGPFVLAAHLCGIERLLMWMAETDSGLADHRARLDELFSLGLETLVAFATAQLEAGATIVQLADSLASINVISPDMYRRYAFPYEKRFFEAMRGPCEKHGALALLHICGDNTRVFEDFVATGADIICVDHAASLRTARTIVGDRACLIGNMDPAGNLLWGSPDEVYREATGLFDAGLPGKYILGTGCEVSVKTPPENLDAMIRAAREYDWGQCCGVGCAGCGPEREGAR